MGINLGQNPIGCGSTEINLAAHDYQWSSGTPFGELDIGAHSPKRCFLNTTSVIGSVCLIQIQCLSMQSTAP